jgi:hypothetical protein
VASAKQAAHRQLAALDELTDGLELRAAQRRAATQRVQLGRAQCSTRTAFSGFEARRAEHLLNV